MTTRHKFLRLSNPPKERPLVKDIGLALLNQYAQKNLTRKEWKQLRPFPIVWWIEKPDAEGNPHRTDFTSKLIDLYTIEAYMDDHGKFDFKEFNLYDPACPWLDNEIIASANFHFIDKDTQDPLALKLPTSLGANFPIVPMLDREGWILNSFQRTLARRIKVLHSKLVDESDMFSAQEWLQDLRAYASECVSLIDITLQQLYSKAQYDPLAGWKFDRAKLGSPFARRVSDKLKWVHHITGQILNATEEVRAFMVLKELRNHIQHWDPPCFACTLEEAAAWLNMMQKVAMLAYKIRKCMKSPLSCELIELLLTPEVSFFPLHPDAPRAPPKSPVGYASITTSLPQPPALPAPVSIVTKQDALHLLKLTDAMAGSKKDPRRQELVKMLLRMVADTSGLDAANEEAAKRGLS